MTIRLASLPPSAHGGPGPAGSSPSGPSAQGGSQRAPDTEPTWGSRVRTWATRTGLPGPGGCLPTVFPVLNLNSNNNNNYKVPLHQTLPFHELERNSLLKERVHRNNHR